MRIYSSMLTVCLFLVIVTVAAGSAQTPPSPKRFTKDDVLKLLNGNVPVKRVETLARERGIDFQLTPETESELRRAGATDPLLAALRDLALKPPTLVVTTTPGGARVYVDDEFLGTTSSEGRLKLSTLAPGSHKLRLSLDGYHDYEQSIDLAVGKMLDVSAALKSNIETARLAGSSDELTATGGNSLRASIPGGALAFFGSLRGHSIYTGPTLAGTMFVGRGKLQFSCKDNKHDFVVDLKDVVPLNQYKGSVEFEVRTSNKKMRHTFWVQMGGKDSSEEAAKELYEALKAGSK